MNAAMLLLTGGSGRRMGGPKHSLPHPDGGSWGGSLVRTFAAVFPGAPVWVLGAPLPDHPTLPQVDDPREGPAVALRAWATQSLPEAARWWIVACDQIRWTPDRLQAWAHRTEAADPSCAHWVLAQHEGRLQPLGGWFPACLLPALQTHDQRSLLELTAAFPRLVLRSRGPEWLDVDTPEARRAFEGPTPLRQPVR
jgi:molybdopterin-guanine dinucleotide biosynthesis protein A